jgi:hypothetical protein
VAFPDFEDSPSGGAESGAVALIAHDVGTALFRPETRVGRGRRLAELAAMHVPEASMYEENSAGACEDKIGLAGQRFAVQAVAESEAVQQRAHSEFGLCVAAPNARHVVTALFRCKNVAQGNMMSLP